MWDTCSWIDLGLEACSPTAHLRTAQKVTGPWGYYHCPRGLANDWHCGAVRKGGIRRGVRQG